LALGAFALTGRGEAGDSEVIGFSEFASQLENWPVALISSQRRLRRH
jgi:hypothetical protein